MDIAWTRARLGPGSNQPEPFTLRLCRQQASQFPRIVDAVQIDHQVHVVARRECAGQRCGTGLIEQLMCISPPIHCSLSRRRWQISCRRSEILAASVARLNAPALRRETTTTANQASTQVVQFGPVLSVDICRFLDRMGAKRTRLPASDELIHPVLAQRRCGFTDDKQALAALLEAQWSFPPPDDTAGYCRITPSTIAAASVGTLVFQAAMARRRPA